MKITLKWKIQIVWGVRVWLLLLCVFLILVDFESQKSVIRSIIFNYMSEGMCFTLSGIESECQLHQSGHLATL